MLSSEEIEEWRRKVQKNRYLLIDAPEEIKNNPDIILDIAKSDKCVRTFGSGLKYASDELMSNPEFAMKLVSIAGWTLSYLPKFADNQEIVMEAMKHEEFRLVSMSKDLQQNPEVIVNKIEKKEDLVKVLNNIKNDWESTNDYYEHGWEAVMTEEDLYWEGWPRPKELDYFPKWEEALNKKLDLVNDKLKKQSDITEKISQTKTIVTHFGDDLDNKASVYALEKFAKENGVLEVGENLTVERVPAGKIKEGYLNVDTGGHKGSRFGDDTLVIDGNPAEGINSAVAEISNLGIYVPKQIVELADVVPNKVSPLESRTALSLIRSASGEQIFEIAEAGLLDKELTDEQLEKYGLVQAHEKQQEIIDNAVEKVNKYSTELANGEKVVIAPEQILAGAQVAYELGANYYASIQAHKSGNGSTFAVTSKPGVQLPEEVKQFGQELVEKYQDPTDGTSGVFLNPNGQMLVAGGMKNPDFSVEYTPEELMEKLNSMFKTYEINSLKDTGYTPEQILQALSLRKEDLEQILAETNEGMEKQNPKNIDNNKQEGQTQGEE